MADISNIPNLSEIIQKNAYNFGLDLKDYFETQDAQTRAYIDGKYALLAQEDTRVNAVIDNLLKISDAQPGTPEWDEGQNLYTLISNNYVGLADRITQTETDIAALQAFATQTTQDISTWMSTVNGRIDSEIARAQGEEAAIRQEIATLKTSLENKDALTDEAIATITAQIGSLQTAMTNRQTEIAALQTKQTEYGARLDALEGKFLGLDTNAAVSEFRRGLAGQASAFGYIRQPVA